ncbi:MAG: hypothetical protein KKE73_00840 [Proteobacteria bacterium]|nr:hypothetical protein [Pseudomonadota bacterium]
MERYGRDFGILIDEWLRQQAENPDTGTGDAIEELCSVMDRSNDPTPLYIIAAHCGYGIYKLQEHSE